MKLIAVQNSPSWLKRHPESGMFYIDIYRKERGRLCKSLKEKNSKERAKLMGEKLIASWLSDDPSQGKEKATFAEVAQEFLKNYEAEFKAEKIRLSTIVKARRYIGKYLHEEFGHLYVNQITEREWKRFVAEKRMKDPSVNLDNHWKHMGYVMRYAKKCKLIQDEWDVENPSDQNFIGRVITEEEKKALFECATPTLVDQMLFASTMGMRLNEHLKLSWDTSYCCHVNLELRTVTICDKHSKTHKGRTIAMSVPVYDMLMRRATFEYWYKGYKRRNLEKTKWVFPSERDKTKPADNNSKAWKSTKQRAKIKGRLRYHDWRHTWLTEAAKLVRSGDRSVALVCAYAGLSIRTFEKHYLHLNSNDTKEIAHLVSAIHYRSPTEKPKKQKPIEESFNIAGKLRESTMQKGELI